ncbi:TPA: hypothetical protein KNN56_001734 [Clostridioides difficile]|uniref:hypothetical protein n=1 Tax=Clostridioides difficile TaxID=1496 RepID=UPI00038CD0F7|nr:hypothetical protein [Clostridioides difficile]EGT4625321.1 hypothetical protein [Clostridioides difficile]ELX4576113.1 hypothetical protein [Clostridioides difficile]EQK76211.1 hypothetical protein QEE_1759 [Clostridioides difficile CD113]MBH6986709.1 hypothetical protein [Clostridioides difficile]MBH7139371.1 hypothetical protein [Clostridioides difficile]
MKYQFFDNDGKVTESEQKSYTDALKFAEERSITCLSMPYEIFIASFRKKIKLLESHAQYSKFSEYAEKMIILNQSVGYQAMAANDFMKKIIVTPIDDIMEWLEEHGKIEFKPVSQDWQEGKAEEQRNKVNSPKVR